MMSIAIVVAAFNRPSSLVRLLKSITRAEYPAGGVPLVISIDYQDSVQHRDVVAIAKNFEWTHGEKRIIEHQQNLGLRKHILSCGCLTEIYPAVIVLEDDIYVSKQYYNYACRMLEAYGNDDRIAGISLYSHEWNQFANRPFIPEPCQYDVYLLQLAKSWGQCWNTRMWDGFYRWYKENETRKIEGKDVPRIVANWPASSWLKYHITYTIRTNKYFVYPYYSLSTNFSEMGVHHALFSNSFQVVLRDVSGQYRLPSFDNATKYDAFFERDGLEEVLGLNKTDLSIDLYGCKEDINTRYLLTTQRLPFNVLASYGLHLRPHELNIVHAISGDDIFLYDTSIHVDLQKKKGETSKLLLYDYKNLGVRKLICLFKLGLKEKLFSGRKCMQVFRSKR